MRKNNPNTVNEYLSNKYGLPGDDKRNEFRMQAQAFMIAELVREARKKANLTQAELAEKVMLKRPHISRIERAKADIRLSTLNKIARGLGCNLSISFESNS